MFGFQPFSSAPFSALSSSLLADMSVAFSLSITLEGMIEDPYANFVRNPTARRVYTVEIGFRAA